MLYSLRHFFVALTFKLLEEDKIKHMAWSFCLTLMALAVLSPVLAFGAVFLIGLAKECWDHFYGSGFCWFDMMGNLIGIAAALALGSLFIYGFLAKTPEWCLACL
jgi:hypothetical protein